MTDAQTAHNFPDLTEQQALMGLLSETLEIVRDLEITQHDIKEAKGDVLEELIATAGLPEEIETASKTAQATITKILTCVSEEDLEAGRDEGLLTPEDHTQALKAKRTLELARGHSSEREEEREA